MLLLHCDCFTDKSRSDDGFKTDQSNPHNFDMVYSQCQFREVKIDIENTKLMSSVQLKTEDIGESQISGE